MPEEEEPVEAEDDTSGPSEESFPVETSITISKNGKGALTIDAVAQGKSARLLPWRRVAPHGPYEGSPGGRAAARLHCETRY